MWVGNKRPEEAVRRLTLGGLAEPIAHITSTEKKTRGPRMVAKWSYQLISLDPANPDEVRRALTGGLAQQPQQPTTQSPTRIPSSSSCVSKFQISLFTSIYSYTQVREFFSRTTGRLPPMETAFIRRSGNKEPLS